MTLLRVTLGVLAVMLVGPLIFIAYYSIQVGCFLCLEGEAAGSDAEMWMNIGFLAFLTGAVVATFRARRRSDQ